MSDLNRQFVRSQWSVGKGSAPDQWNVVNDLKSSDTIAVQFHGPPGVADQLANEFVAWKNAHYPNTFAVPSDLGVVEVVADPPDVDEVGTLVTVTASVVDRNGDVVPDGTLVDFVANQNANLQQIGTGHMARATVDGVVQARYVILGPGVFVFVAAVGNVSGTAVLTSSA